MKSSLVFSFSSLLGPVLAANAYYNSFYPPTLNDTSYITNSSLGTYNGTYSAGATTPSIPTPPGTYDYCAEPHPNLKTYQLPGPVANGTVSASLVFLQYISRHQRRTPYGVLPGGSYQAWNCDQIQPYLYSGPAGNILAQQPMRVYAATYTDPSNPFTKALDAPPGTCQFPQLTIGGLLDGYQHGQDLWGVYGEKLQFLPRGGPDYSTYFRSSESPLTQSSAGGLLRGIWPWFDGAVPLHQEVSVVDTVNEGFTCNYRGKVLSAMESTPEWYAHLNATAPLLASLEWMTQNVSTWTASLNGFADNIQCWQCNGYKIPCNANNTAQCVTEAQTDGILRAADWEWNYWYRNNANSTAYIQSLEGNFIGEILNNFAAVQNGTNKYRYVHDFLHDNDVGPIVAALGISSLRWPGFGSNIAFEIWKQDSGTLYARVLYSGQPISTIYGVLDWVPLATLESILKPYVPADIVALCNS